MTLLQLVIASLTALLVLGAWFIIDMIWLASLVVPIKNPKYVVFKQTVAADGMMEYCLQSGHNSQFMAKYAARQLKALGLQSIVQKNSQGVQHA